VKKLIVDFIYVEQYFDLKEFEKPPLKEIIRYEFRTANSLFKVGNTYSMKRNKVSVNNSPIGFGNSGTYNF